MADNPRLDAQDIQGNIIPGFRRRRQMLLAYAGGSEGALRRALAVLAPHVTAIAPVIRHRDGRKHALAAGEQEPESPDLWVNLALGAKALDRLGENGVRDLDRAFDTGMRPARTGDPWSLKDAAGAPNPWHPSNWIVGKPLRPLDLLVILAFDDWAVAGGDALLAALEGSGVEEIYREEGVRLPGESEHFGFMDGIAEIGIRGEIEIDGVPRAITTRYGVPLRNGVEYGRPGQPLAWPGQFLIGVATGQNSTEAVPERYRNGSFLVFRRLNQDVQAFDEDTQAMADQLGVPARRLRAAIVGRWPSGSSLMRHPNEPTETEDHLALNYFHFGLDSPGLELQGVAVAGATADPAPIRGITCPAFAHIRKVNPRDLPTDLGDEALTRGFQMLRRSIPFGPAFDRANLTNPANDAERGLLFLAYQRAPSLQFEKLNTSWMNQDDGPGPGGFDLLIGQRVSPQTGQYEPKNATLYDAAEPAPGRAILAQRTWVRPSGGAYLFAPSLSHIAAMALAPPPVVADDAASTFVADVAALQQGTAMLTFGLDVKVASAPVTVELLWPRHDGETLIRTEPSGDRLLAADWPETALLAPAVAALRGASIAALDLSGEHFPTRILARDEAAALAANPELRHLKLDGVTLNGAMLAALLHSLPNLHTLDLTGLDLDDGDVATFIEDRDDLVELRLGIAEPREGHRFGSPRLTGAVVRKLERSSGLRRLSLRKVPITDAEVIASDLWDRLTQVNLSETWITDAGAERLARSLSLAELSLESTAVGDRGAAALLKRRWRTLHISRTDISQTALLAARHPESLRQLHLAGLPLDDHLAELVNKAVNLEEIDLSDTAVTSRVADSLGGLSALTRVKAGGTALAPDDIARLLRAPIVQLGIEGLRTDTAAREALARSPTLQRIALSTGADWRGLEALRAEVTLTAAAPTEGELPARLRQLQLAGVLTKELGEKLGRLEGLRELSVGAVHQDVEFARGFGNLREFRAEGAGLTDEMVAKLLALPAMSALYISDNVVGLALEGTLSPFIHTLELRHTDIGDSALTAIAQLPRLHCIDVPQTKVSAAGIALLARNAVNLQSLALDGSQVDRTSIDALADCERLLELYLYGPDVTDATVAAIASLHLRELQLIGTSISDEAVPHLAAIPGLRRLSLGGKISAAGLAALRALRPFLEIR